MSGQRASNPQQTLALLLSKKDQLQEELRTVEKQVVLPLAIPIFHHCVISVRYPSLWELLFSMTCFQDIHHNYVTVEDFFLFSQDVTSIVNDCPHDTCL